MASEFDAIVGALRGIEAAYESRIAALKDEREVLLRRIEDLQPQPPVSGAYDIGVFPISPGSTASNLTAQIQARQFLNHATFGAIESEVTVLANRINEIGRLHALDEWFEAQWELPVSYHMPAIKEELPKYGYQLWRDGAEARSRDITDFRQYVWWNHAISAPDQLRQRIAFTLSQICVVGQITGDQNARSEPEFADGSRWLGKPSYYDMLLGNTDRAYADVLRDVTFHPIMGEYLSAAKNRKADPRRGTQPDENYAREIMQLFSIGLWELNEDGTKKLDDAGKPIPTYDTDDVQELARLFTGFKNQEGDDYTKPMDVIDNFHDMDPKSILGVALPPPIDGKMDILNGLEVLQNHPNLGPFIARRFIQRFVKSNPTPEYIGRVAEVFRATNGSIKLLTKAVLLDPEALATVETRIEDEPLRVVVSSNTSSTSVMETVLLFTRFMRLYFPKPFPWVPIYWSHHTGPQAPYEAPSVFNYFQPDYQPNGPLAGTDYVAPETTLYTPGLLNELHNRYLEFIGDGEIRFWMRVAEGTAGSFKVNNRFHDLWQLNFYVPLDLEEERMLAGNPAALVRRLNLKLCNGTASSNFTNKLAESLETHIPVDQENYQAERAKAAIHILLTSPYSMVKE